MKLTKVTKNDPLERLAVSCRRSVLSMLADYQEYYRQTYGDPIEKSLLVEEILRSFMESDKAFMAARVSKSFKEAQAEEMTRAGLEPQAVVGEGASLLPDAS